MSLDVISRSRRTAAALALVASLLLAAGFAPAALAAGERAASPALADGVVVDAARGVAYVMNAQGGIDAVELARGTTSWATDAAAKPLLVDGETLLAQAKTGAAGQLPLALISLGADKGARPLAVELPAGVQARLVDGRDGFFRLEAEVGAAGEVVLTWLSASIPVQGALLVDEGAPLVTASATLTERRLAHPATHQEGAAAVQLATGVARAMPVEEARGRLATRAGAERFAVKADGARQYLSADGRHFLVSQTTQAADPASRYRWTLVERASGAVLGSLATSAPTAPFVISGSRLILVAQPRIQRVEGKWLEEARTLKAIDLATGAQLWTRAVVDPTFRGPAAP
ncbi:MAG TPA: hypothetical protein VF017_05330 [Thermoanaerobaculia bacterium]|nr:hypothetical protein [Thermoanaerobaculia bacterium]